MSFLDMIMGRPSVPVKKRFKVTSDPRGTYTLYKWDSYDKDWNYLSSTTIDEVWKGWVENIRFGGHPEKTEIET